MELARDTMIFVAEQQKGMLVDVLSGGGINHPYVTHFSQTHGMTPQESFTVLKHDAEDILGMGVLATEAQTVIFETAFALSIRGSLSRFGWDGGKLHLPFPTVIYQFSKPIPEALFFEIQDPTTTGLEDAYRAAAKVLNPSLGGMYDGIHDFVLALMVCELYDDSTDMMIYNAYVFYVSGEMMRVKWTENDPPEVFAKVTPKRDSTIGAVNKNKAVQLATACTLYINCANVALKKHETPAKVNAKRARQGKRILPPYHTTYIARSYGESPQEQQKARATTGRHVSFMFPVAGHFRRLSDRTIWVSSHYRGLDQADKPRPKVYKANPRDWDVKR